jgi:hypothetical protein
VWYSYVRLELLEGVVAYHNGQSEKARGSLTSAQAKYLQVYSLIHHFYYFAPHCFSTISRSVNQCDTYILLNVSGISFKYQMKLYQC